MVVDDLPVGAVSPSPRAVDWFCWYAERATYLTEEALSVEL